MSKAGEMQEERDRLGKRKYALTQIAETFNVSRTTSTATSTLAGPRRFRGALGAIPSVRDFVEIIVCVEIPELTYGGKASIQYNCVVLDVSEIASEAQCGGRIQIWHVVENLGAARVFAITPFLLVGAVRFFDPEIDFGVDLGVARIEAVSIFIVGDFNSDHGIAIFFSHFMRRPPLPTMVVQGIANTDDDRSIDECVSIHGKSTSVESVHK
jgi:hypothetical protein